MEKAVCGKINVEVGEEKGATIFQNKNLILFRSHQTLNKLFYNPSAYDVIIIAFHKKRQAGGVRNLLLLLRNNPNSFRHIWNDWGEPRKNL